MFGGNAHEALSEGTSEFRGLFLDFFARARVLLLGPFDFLDTDLICIGVNVHHALRATREDGLQEFEKLDLSLKHL